MKQYRIEGLTTTRWDNDPRVAWEKYCNASERAGVRDPGHIPGDVCGDAHESDHSAIYAVRDGHATVTLRRKNVV